MPDLMRKMSTVLVGVLLATVLIASLPGLTIAESAPLVSQVEQVAAENVEPQATRDYYFDIVVPAFGSTYDPRTFTMSAGKYCLVQRTDTTYWTASFRVVDASTLGALGDWVQIDRGQTKLIYTNTSGQTQNVKIELSATVPASVHTTGWFKFGDF